MIERKIVAEVLVPDSVFPWIRKADDNGKIQKYYNDDVDPLLGLKGQPFQFGYSSSKQAVLFLFFEGCDLNKVMLFKLAWGGK